MKCEVNKKFRPVEITLTIESEEELCNLWHRLNNFSVPERLSLSMPYPGTLDGVKELFDCFDTEAVARGIKK